MKSETFWQQLPDKLELPFDLEDVTSIESNCGSVWINMNTGETYFIQIDKCEPETT